MIREALGNDVRRVASELGYDAVTDRLLAEARECVYIFDDEEGDTSRAGGSRLGGEPDLPPGAAWPGAEVPDERGRARWSISDEDAAAFRHAEFLAQFALGDVPAFEGSPLPRVGRLWLFVSGWKEHSEVGITSFYSAGGGLVRQAAPKGKGPNLVASCSPLRFELGVSLPFGRTSFREAIGYTPDGQVLVWEQLAEALTPPGCVGQIGGFAFSYEGYDLRRDMVLGRLGHREYIQQDQYDGIGELEESARRIPPYIKTDEERRLWQESYEKLRPQVAWIEQHQSEIMAWELLMMLKSNMEAGFSLGDSYPLWLFGRVPDLEQGRFDKLVGVCAV